MVPTHLVGDHPLRMAVPAPDADVEVAIVEEDPRLGLLAGGLAFVRFLLDEASHRFHSRVSQIVQLAVENDGLDHAGCSQRDAPLGVTRHHLGSTRRGRGKSRERSDIR